MPFGAANYAINMISILDYFISKHGIKMKFDF